MKLHILMVLAGGLLLGACSKKEAPPPAAPPEPAAETVSASTPAQASLAGVSGRAVTGTLQLTSVPEGVSISGQVTGLAPSSPHGFHVHETGDCSAPDAKSAGDHFNPAKQNHGGPEATERHLGDLPNLQSDATGNVSISTTIAGATLRDGGPNDLMGKALVVHAKRDDYVSQPAGDSGDRIACGVIR
jgi:superoxide dismutase, Cu-Zn family